MSFAMRTLRLIVGFCVALVLSGCFISDKPLITPETADYLIGDRAVFIKSSIVREQTEYEPFDNAVVITREFPDKLSKTGGYYVHEETGANGLKTVTRGLMKKLDDKTYLVMGEDREENRYWYGIFVQEGEDFVEYKILCEDLIASAKRTGVTLESMAVTRTPSGACKFDSFDKLTYALNFARGVSSKARAWARYKPQH